MRQREIIRIKQLSGAGVPGSTFVYARPNGGSKIRIYGLVLLKSGVPVVISCGSHWLKVVSKNGKVEFKNAKT
jgi:hypothetical protein